MKERPILFSSAMVKALLDGRKTVTRRVIKPQPELIYGLTDDSIKVIHNEHENKKWSDIEGDSGFSERRLYGGRRWEDLFQDQIRRVWGEGLRGLVSISRVKGKQGIFYGELVPQKQEGDEIGSPAGLHGFSRNAESAIVADPASGWKQGELRSVESKVGQSKGTMDGCQKTRNISRRGTSLGGEVHQFGERALALGDTKEVVQPENCCGNVGRYPIMHLRHCSWWVGQTMWVRETGWERPDRTKKMMIEGADTWASYYFDADGLVEAEHEQFKEWGFKRRPSIFMPRWASRITLEVTDVRVERIQDIGGEDIKSEGVQIGGSKFDHPSIKDEEAYQRALRFAWIELWDSLNKSRGFGWDVNPWVWCISFRPVAGEVHAPSTAVTAKEVVEEAIRNLRRAAQ